MSIASYITSIETSRNTIRNKLIELGIAASGDKLDRLAAAIEGIINRGAVSVTVQEGDTYTIPAGYHNGSGTVSGIAGGGNYSLQAKTATPTKKQQNIVPDSGYYGLSGVTVNAIPDAYQDVSSVTAGAGDVLTGKVFVTSAGVVTAGEMVNNGAVSKTLDAITVTYTIPKGYHSGTGKVTITLEEKAVTPTKAAQTVTPSNGKVLSKVVVDPIPDNFIDTSDADAAAGQILAGSKAYVDGVLVEGTMPDNSVEGSTYSYLTPAIPSRVVEEGYHNGNETIMVRSTEETVTPTKEQQTVQDSNSYFKKVVVEPIPDQYQDVTPVTATAADVLAGKKIVAADGTVITGTMANNGAVNKVLDTSETVFTIPEGYHDGTGGVVIVPETKSVTPTKSKQTVNPSIFKVLRIVSVNPIPDAYQDVTKVDAVAGEVLDGKKIVAADGTVITGSMPNNGQMSKTIDGLTTTSVTIPAGYTSGGTVSLTDDIEQALAAI